MVYFAGYKKLVDRYKVDQIEAAADLVVWCSDEAPGFEPGRPGDRRFVGNIVRAMQAYADGELGEPAIPLDQVDRIVAIGSDRMMHAVALARHTVLAPHLKPRHVAIGSINSPMQCMMKEICAQCLQAHKDPATGAETVVFSCFNQDQDLDRVDFPSLNERLRQNGVQEKLTAQWIDRCLKALQVRRRAAEAGQAALEIGTSWGSRCFRLRRQTVSRSRCRVRTSSGTSPRLTSSSTDLKGRLARMRLARAFPICFRLVRWLGGAWLMLIAPVGAAFSCLAVGRDCFGCLASAFRRRARAL